MSFFNKIKTPLLVLIIIALLGAIGYLMFFDDPDPAPKEQYEWESSLQPEIISYGGADWAPNPDITTILIGGVDVAGKLNLSAGVGGQVDVLMLLVVNSGTKTVDMLQINRDTMANVTVLNDNYVETGKVRAQIALSHAYGNGGTISAKNTVKAVEELLFDIDIDKYMFVNMDAIELINDYLGGIEVEVVDDFSAIDATIPLGPVKLTGSQALSYLRARTGLSDPSNSARMARHRTYMSSLVNSLRTCVVNATDSPLELYNRIYDYMVTSLSSTELASLVSNTADYTVNETIVPEGTFSENTQLEEFNVDEGLLRNVVVSLFYRRIYE